MQVQTKVTVEMTGEEAYLVHCAVAALLHQGNFFTGQVLSDEEKERLKGIHEVMNSTFPDMDPEHAT